VNLESCPRGGKKGGELAEKRPRKKPESLGAARVKKGGGGRVLKVGGLQPLGKEQETTVPIVGQEGEERVFFILSNGEAGKKKRPARSGVGGGQSKSLGVLESWEEREGGGGAAKPTTRKGERKALRKRALRKRRKTDWENVQRKRGGGKFEDAKVNLVIPRASPMERCPTGRRPCSLSNWKGKVREPAGKRDTERKTNHPQGKSNAEERVRGPQAFAQGKFGKNCTEKLRGKMRESG